MNRLPPALGTGLLAVLLPVSACTDRDPVGPKNELIPDFFGTCDSEGGTLHRGTVSGTWTRNQSPHRLPETVYVSGELLVEAGALVCAGPGAAISWRRDEPGIVMARGTTEAPVIFTADRPGGVWGGFKYEFCCSDIQITARVDLRHVVIENATAGIDLRYPQSAAVTHGVIRRIEGRGVHARTIQLESVVLDSVCLAGGTCTAVSAPNYASVVLDDVSILNSGGAGFEMGDRGRLTLSNVRIIGSAGVGLKLIWYRSGALERVEHPIRITGGRGRPAVLPPSIVKRLLPSLEAQEQWTGNAEDVVEVATEVAGSGLIDDLVVGPRLAWELSHEPFVRDLRLLPGARFSGSRVGRITAEGAPDHPIVISGTIVLGSESGPSRITHARLRDAIMYSGAAHPLELRDVIAETGYVSLDAPGSRLERVFVRGQLHTWPSNQLFYRRPPEPAPAVRIAAADVVLERCEILGSAQDGIRVEVADGVRIHDCNLHGNLGAAIRNVAASPVDARHNWWGDALGPGGVEGDRIVGAVTFEPYRLAPLALGGPVPRELVLTPAASIVPVGDTARFDAAVLDGAGLRLWKEPLEWRTSDSSRIVVDSTGRITAVAVGSADVTVLVRADTSLRRTATVHAIPGAPSYNWTRLDLRGSSLWGSPEAGLYAADHNGVHLYDGSQWVLRWSRQDMGAASVQRIGGVASKALWALGAGASGGGSTLFRWDGNAWQAIPAPFESGGDLWAAGSSQVYVTAPYGELERGLWLYDGGRFQRVVAEVVTRVWGRSPQDVFAATAGGVLHFDGHQWRSVGGPQWVQAFWGTDDQIFAVSPSSLYRYDGAAWDRLDCSTPSNWNVRGIWGTSPSNIFMAGYDGVVRHFDGSRCWNVWLGREQFTSVWGYGSDVVILGLGGSFHGRPTQ
jgi:hypothetical protein